MESLERRELMTCNYLLDGSQLSISGWDQLDDRVTVWSEPWTVGNLVLGVKVYAREWSGVRTFLAKRIDSITFDGKDGNDRLDASGVASSIRVEAEGGDGRDTLIGGQGNDYLRGGDSNDYLKGGPGNDTLAGERGCDTVYGGSGNDVVHGDLDGPSEGVDVHDGAPDLLYGDSGNDTILGGMGGDTICGGSGNDYLYGGAIGSTEHTNGESGDDLIFGDSGRDRLSGQDGDDTLCGGSGSDTLLGGVGNDTLDGGGDQARDYLFGNSGQDTFYQHVSYSDGHYIYEDYLVDYDSDDDTYRWYFHIYVPPLLP